MVPALLPKGEPPQPPHTGNLSVPIGREEDGGAETAKLPGLWGFWEQTPSLPAWGDREGGAPQPQDSVPETGLYHLANPRRI